MLGRLVGALLATGVAGAFLAQPAGQPHHALPQLVGRVGQVRINVGHVHRIAVHFFGKIWV